MTFCGYPVTWVGLFVDYFCVSIMKLKQVVLMLCPDFFPLYFLSSSKVFAVSVKRFLFHGPYYFDLSQSSQRNFTFCHCKEA